MEVDTIVHSYEDLLLMPVHQIAFPAEMVVFRQSITDMIPKLGQELHKYNNNKITVFPVCQQSSVILLCYLQSRITMMTYWPFPRFCWN